MQQNILKCHALKAYRMQKYHTSKSANIFITHDFQRLQKEYRDFMTMNKFSQVRIKYVSSFQGQFTARKQLQSNLRQYTCNVQHSQHLNNLSLMEPTCQRSQGKRSQVKVHRSRFKLHRSSFRSSQRSSYRSLFKNQVKQTKFHTN